MRRSIVPFAAILLLSAGCAPAKKDEPAPSGSVAIRLAPATGSDIEATITVLDPAGSPVLGAPPDVTVAGGTHGSVVETGGGEYQTTVTPDALDSEVAITATASGASATKTALAFGIHDPALGVAEAVDGLVNTNGWEDGANVSADGQWLIVSTYVPLDALSCGIAGTTPTAPACTTITGPYAAPERPGMLGADRIHGTTYDNVCPRFGLTTPSTTVALIPVAAYGFHRQSDGSFAEPFVIGYQADGCLGPYGFGFVSQPAGAAASAIFADHDPLEGGDGSNADLWYTPLTMGQPNILGTYQYSGGVVTVSGKTAVKIPPVLSTRQGNPFYANGRVYWDDENLAEADRDLYFATLTGTMPSVTASSAQTVSVSLPGVEEIQPAWDGQDFYWAGGGAISTAVLTSGGDPATAGAFTSRHALLGSQSTTHPIVAIGEPSIAHPAGGKELYFVFVRKTATGYDAGVGRVPFL